jgi:hypothetical protein
MNEAFEVICIVFIFIREQCPICITNLIVPVNCKLQLISIEIGVIINQKAIMEFIMKKSFITFLIVILLAAFWGVAGAEERIVQLTAPGCAA